MMEWTTIIILFVSAMLLILSEFFVPGAVLGFLGAILLLSSCAVGWYTYPEYVIFIVLAELVGTALSIMGGMYLMSRTQAVNPLVMHGEQNNKEGWSSPSADAGLVGALGEVHTALRPAGTIVIDGKRIDAVSDGELIEQGAAIRVIEVEGNRVVVETAATENE